jgi:hypothetical protein
LERVHVFISIGRFRSFEDMRAFIDKTYTEDGDGVPSPFIREVGLSGYEPGRIEAVHKDAPTPLARLLAAASYADQWLAKVDSDRIADSAICVFAPNRVARPTDSCLEVPWLARAERLSSSLSSTLRLRPEGSLRAEGRRRTVDEAHPLLNKRRRQPLSGSPPMIRLRLLISRVLFPADESAGCGHFSGTPVAGRL